MAIQSVNPATQEVIEKFRPLEKREIDSRLEAAARAFKAYRKTSFAERARWTNEAARILETEKEAFGKLMTLEMGKPVQAAIEEAAKCALACRYYAENAERFLADQEVATQAERSFVRFQPLGPILAVMPWNFPFWQVFRFVAPALMAGNVGLLKHASNVPRCALAIEGILKRAGFPENVFQTLLIGSEQVREVLEDPRVVAATLTGSEFAGADVGRIAGGKIKKTVLELGGSDPFVVMPSADIAATAKMAARARTINNGQSCIAAKRFIVHEAVAAEFERGFVKEMRALKVGDPMDPGTQIGPLATPKILEEVERIVDESVRMGAKVLLGGKRSGFPSGMPAGNYYEPSILTDIPETAPAYSEEVFGPVALLFRVGSLNEALELANESKYGLGASVWTNDENEKKRFIEEIESGLCFVNAIVASDPRLPFGGVKHSGYGRELGRFGIEEFVNIKTVWMQEGAKKGPASATE